MEGSWDMCPYCQKTGFIPSLGDLKKTRIDSTTTSTSAAVTAPLSVPVPRKTVVMADLHKAPLMGWVVVLDGNDKGRDFHVRDGQNLMGSDPTCNIVISNPTVSGKHASLRSQDGKFFLTDLDSTNGTYLNRQEKRIAREEIKDNDYIRLGEVTLKFKCI